MGVSPDRHVPSWDGSPSGADWGLGGDILGRGLGDGLRALVGDLTNAIKGIGVPMGLMADIQGEMDTMREGQLTLEDRTDLLSPLLDYGSCFTPATDRLHGTGFAPFTEPLGPMRGCEILPGYQGGIRLLDKGLWDIRLHLSADKVISSNNTFEFELRIYYPDGPVFSRQRFKLDDANVITGTIVSSVVVEEPGYEVLVYVTNMAGQRGLLGGPAWSRLAVQHITREVENGRGDEPSTPVE